MNAGQAHQGHRETQQRLAAEVIELGESLFEMALEAGTDQPAAIEETTMYPVEEIQAATADFFIALRLLLGMTE